MSNDIMRGFAQDVYRHLMRNPFEGDAPVDVTACRCLYCDAALDAGGVQKRPTDFDFSDRPYSTVRFVPGIGTCPFAVGIIGPLTFCNDEHFAAWLAEKYPDVMTTYIMSDGGRFITWRELRALKAAERDGE